MIRSSYLLIVFFIAIKTFGQNGSIEGTVLNEKGEPLPGASVIYRKDVTIGANTDANGFYQLTVPSGSCRLIVRFTGMQTDTLSVNVVANQTQKLNIILKGFVKDLKQVDLRVGKFDKPLEEQTVTMLVLRPELIENKNTRSIETALDQTPGLNILDGEPQIRGGSGFTFGV
ncbi:MAG: carboxypeptidase regulatory-like domain-containing protein, partial [Bacteroidota bacterium]